MYQTAMCYISIDSSWHALQINGKPFSNFGIIFWITLFIIIVALGLGMRGGGGIYADQHPF